MPIEDFFFSHIWTTGFRCLLAYTPNRFVSDQLRSW